MDTNLARKKSCALALSAMLMLTFLTQGGGVSASEPLPAADLEQGFWQCDYIATTRGVHATPVELCSAIMEELKARKFGGDFEELVGWWQRNKAVEHQKLEALVH